MDIRTYIRRALAAFERGKQFVRHDIWHIGQPGETIPSGFFIKQLRVGILLARGLMEETLLLRASALTFTTMLFIVPFLVFMFSFIQTFHLGDQVYGKISGWVNHRIGQVVDVVKGSHEQGTAESTPPVAGEMPEHGTMASGATAASAEDAASQKSTASDKQLADDILRTLLPSFSEKSNNGQLADPVEFIVGIVEDRATDIKTLGLTGLMYIIITVLGLMRNVEWSFNRIWGVTETRRLLRTFSDYLMITLLLPIVAAVMLGITAALTTNDMLGHLSIVLRGGQVLIISLTFSLLYYLVPNTTVRIRCALMGGLVAGILWTLTAWAYVTFNVGLAKYTFFFSAFALFPMLLAWIYVSWLILLFGALVTFAYQNEKTFALERLASTASYAYREAVAVRLMVEMARRFALGESAFHAGELAEAWNVPSRLIHEALEILVGAKLVTVCSTQPATYQPSRAADKIRIHDVVNALRENGEDPSDLRKETTYRALYEKLGRPDTGSLDATVADIVGKGIVMLAGKTAIITGAGRGIGRAMAVAFAGQGCNIAALARSRGEIDETVAAVRALGREGVAIVCDVRDPTSVTEAFAGAEGALGPIDILVNNAGVACFKPFMALRLDKWEETLAVNLTGVFLCTQAVLPGMMERRAGKIINISSVSGLKPIAEQSAYCAAKHGVNGLTKTLALELQPYGIGVHAICPGGVVTQLSEEAMPGRDKSGWMLPEDIAHAALFLATQSERATTDIVHIRRFESSPL